MSEFKFGDRVRVTLEGQVVFQSATYLTLQADGGGNHSIYMERDSAHVEKIEPPVEVFKPGDVVRDKDKPELIYALGADGYMRVGKGSSFCGGGWPHYDYGGEVFTSKRYEKVNLS